MLPLLLLLCSLWWRLVVMVMVTAMANGILWANGSRSKHKFNFSDISNYLTITNTLYHIFFRRKKSHGTYSIRHILSNCKLFHCVATGWFGMAFRDLKISCIPFLYAVEKCFLFCQLMRATPFKNHSFPTYSSVGLYRMHCIGLVKCVMYA